MCAYQRVKNVSFSENFAYVLNGWPLTFLFLVNWRTSKPVISPLTLLHIRTYTFHCFSRSLRSFKIKYGLIFVQFMKSINLILAILQWLETGSRPCYEFDKIVVGCKLFIFRCLAFSIVPVHTSKRVKNTKLITIDFWLIAVMANTMRTVYF